MRHNFEQCGRLFQEDRDLQNQDGVLRMWCRRMQFRATHFVVHSNSLLFNDGSFTVLFSIDNIDLVFSPFSLMLHPAIVLEIALFTWFERVCVRWTIVLHVCVKAMHYITKTDCDFDTFIFNFTFFIYCYNASLPWPFIKGFVESLMGVLLFVLFLCSSNAM